MNQIESFAEFLEAMSGNLLLSGAVVGGLFLIASLIASAWKKSGQIDCEEAENYGKKQEVNEG